LTIWDDPELYDLGNNHYVRDLPYWRGLVERLQPRRVLELACGTGRVLTTLLSAGRAVDPAFRLVGLDSSAPFLARARSKLAEAAGGEPVTLVEADMTAFDLGEAFDLIVLPYGSLQYLLTIDDQLACLRNVRRHLVPGGRFAIDLIVPQPELVATLSKELGGAGHLHPRDLPRRRPGAPANRSRGDALLLPARARVAPCPGRVDAGRAPRSLQRRAVR
jgi:SAM-dependent methyltransferase